MAAMWKFASTASLLLLATACAETYGPAGTGSRMLMGGGYRDEKLDKQSWRIEYSGADYDWAYRSAVRRSAEIAKREGFPYFTVGKGGGNLSGNTTSGGRYVGSTVFVTLIMYGWQTYEERCKGDKRIGTTMPCDLYNTDKVLTSRR